METERKKTREGGKERGRGRFRERVCERESKVYISTEKSLRASKEVRHILSKWLIPFYLPALHCTPNTIRYKSWRSQYH